MALEKETQQTRHRSMTTGDGGRAEVWLEAGSQVAMRTTHPSGGGGAYWTRCGRAECLGSAIGATGLCYAHADQDARAAHHRDVLAGKHVLDLRGIEIDGALWNMALAAILHDDGHVRAPIHCGGAVFKSKVRMEDVTFAKAVSLYGAILEDGCEVRACAFMAELDIRYAYFHRGPGHFPGCRVDSLLADFCHTEQHVAFTECDFAGEVSAVGAQADFRLEECHVARSCNLSRLDVNALTLRESRFDGDLRLDEAQGKVFILSGMDVFGGSPIGPFVGGMVDASNSHFRRRCDLMTAGSSLNLRGSSFDGGGRVECRSAQIDLTGLVVGAPLSVIGADGASVLSLENADCRQVRLSSIDLSACQFYGCHGLDQIVLEPTVSLSRISGRLKTTRRCIADEIAWREAKAWRRGGRGSASLESQHTGAVGHGVGVRSTLAPAQIAEVYRSLRHSVEAQSNQPGAADFYYGEMEMRRWDSAAGVWDRAIVWAYWLVSGYGLRALRPLFWLLVAFLCGSLVMHQVGIEGHGSWAASFVAAGQSLVPGLPVASHLTDAGWAAQILLKVVGPVLLGLTALALRNRVRR